MTMRIPETQMDSARIEPTERSIPAVRMANSIPEATSVDSRLLRYVHEVSNSEKAWVARESPIMIMIRPSSAPCGSAGNLSVHNELLAALV